MKQLVVFGLCLALALPVLAQGSNFEQLFSGKSTPLAYQLKDLNNEWTRVSIVTQSGSKGDTSDMLSQLMQLGMMSEMGKDGQSSSDPAAEAMLGLAFLNMMFGGGGSGVTSEPVYYTKGQTVTLGGETFLIAYMHQKEEMNLAKMAAESAETGEDPNFEEMASKSKLTAESTLGLVLVNVKTIISVKGIRAFDMEREIAESEKSGGLMDMLAKEMGGKEGAEAAAEPAEATPMPASTLAFMVEDAIIKDAQLSDKRNKITVTPEGDNIVLKGTVVSQYMKSRATTVAQQTVKEFGGTAKVQNHLVVKQPGKK